MFISYKSRSREYAYDLKAMCKKANIRTVSNHLIRKSLATDLCSAGVPQNIVRDLLGHTDFRTTDENYILKDNAAMKTQLQAVSDRITC